MSDLTDDEKKAIMDRQFGPNSRSTKTRERFRAAVELRRAASAYADSLSGDDIEQTAVREVRLQVAAFQYARAVTTDEQDALIELERGL